MKELKKYIEWVLQVMLPSACSFIVDVSLSYIQLSLFTLHVSAYMAIFMCVGCFIFVFLKESASLVLLARDHTLHVFHLCFVPVLFSSLILLFLACVFVCLPFLVVCLFLCLFCAAHFIYIFLKN
jgi:hypothetical protein